MTIEEAEGKALARLAVFSNNYMPYEDGDLLRNLITQYILLKKENADLKEQIRVYKHLKEVEDD